MTNDNPGLKMMLKMGWGGGGLGAEEEGIQEPVNVEEQIIDRQGFGFRQANGISTDFLTNIRKRLEEFSRSGSCRNACIFLRTRVFSSDGAVFPSEIGSKFFSNDSMISPLQNVKNV